MLFSFRTLAHLAALDAAVTIDEVVQAINHLGFEVEAYTPATLAQGVKFGRVLSVRPNPQADQLYVCEVQFEDKPRTIQTAATNVAAGTTVIAFVPGASNGDTVYGPKTLKGVVSEGMLASLSELGVPPDLLRPAHAQGVFTWPEKVPLGTNPLAWLGLDDYMIEVTILSNRADANSYFAMALELSGYFATSVVLPALRLDTYPSSVRATNGKALALSFVEVEHVLPVSLQEQILLAKSRLKSLNDIVDLTNLTMLMTGQPVHAYDAAQITAPLTAEYFTGPVHVLGGKEVALQNDLVITAGHQPIALAGVIGLQGYAITAATTRFLIELGRFKIADVRHALRALRFSTQAGSQSSREFLPMLTYWAVAYLGTKVARHSALINPPPLKAVHIPLEVEAINTLIGEPRFTDGPLYAKAVTALTRLGFEFKPPSVRVAAHIAHISTTQDLVEEIMRFVGYDNLSPLQPVINTSTTTTSDELARRLVAAGYVEVVTHSLVPRAAAAFNPHNLRKMHHLQTFVASEHESLRNSAAPSLANVLDYHERRKLMPLSVGEISYLGGEVQALTLATQTKTLAALQTDLTNLLQLELEFRPWTHPLLHPGVAGQIVVNERVIGWLGKFYPGTHISNPLVAEVQLGHEPFPFKLTMPSHAQLQTRDLTFKLAPSAPLAPIVAALKHVPGVVAVWPIDHYVTPGAETRSVTLRVSGDAAAISTIDKQYN